MGYEAAPVSKPRQILTLSALTLLAYGNSFHVPFVFDDAASIQRNAAVRFGQYVWHLSPRVVLFLTFTLNSVIGGQNVFGYHLVNFVLHLVNGILVLYLARHIVPGAEFWAAALFLLHPIQTESVTYISSRSELLSTTFYLLGVLAFIHWHRETWKCLASTGTCFLMALGTKETAITFPAALLLYDWLFIGGVHRRWRFYAAWLIGGSLTAWYALRVALVASVGNVAGVLPWRQYAMTEWRVIIRYIGLIVLPIHQNLDYDIRPSVDMDPWTLASLLVLAALVGLAWAIRRDAPVITFAVLWFFVTLSATSSVVPIMDVMFEHRLYLPMMGVSIAFPMLFRRKSA